MATGYWSTVGAEFPGRAPLPWGGGNLTGFSNLIAELMPKRLELLSELVPQAKVVALLVNPTVPGGAERQIRAVQEAAQAKGVQLPILKAGTESEIDAAFASLVELHAGALLVLAEPMFVQHRSRLVELAAMSHLPAIYKTREFVEAGGLAYPELSAHQNQGTA